MQTKDKEMHDWLYAMDPLLAGTLKYVLASHVMLPDILGDVISYFCMDLVFVAMVLDYNQHALCMQGIQLHDCMISFFQVAT